MLYAPNYYNRFSCIADRCRHSCCIGWEIDIDKDTLAFYRNTQGAFGEKLRRFISEDETPHFILGEGERCPFLNEKNLCDIYINLGEDHLCQICSDHPRFRNFFEDRTEIGLGLSCEAAAELILNFPEPVRIVNIETNAEDDFFPERTLAFSIMQNREKTVRERICALFEAFNISFPEKSFSEWCDVFLSLEILDPAWETLLKERQKNMQVSEGIPELAKEQFFVYFIFRYMHLGMEENNYAPYLAFAYLGLYMAEHLCENHSDFLEIARLYSAEIEYCPENVEDLIFEIEIG